MVTNKSAHYNQCMHIRYHVFICKQARLVDLYNKLLYTIEKHSAISRMIERFNHTTNKSILAIFLQ